MYQVVEMTIEAKREMYMKFSKEELIEMLIENNNVIERLNKMHVLPAVSIQQFSTVELKKHKQGHPSRFPYMQARTERLFHDKH